MDEAPFRADLRFRRAAQVAARALRAGNVRSLAQLKSMSRGEIMRLPHLGPTGYDYLNDALNRGADERLIGLFPREPSRRRRQV